MSSRSLLRILLDDSAVSGHDLHIAVMRDIKLTAQLLRPKEGNNNDIGVDASHEDANNLTIVVAVLDLLRRRQGEPLPNRRLDGRAGGRNEVTQLVRGTDSKGSDRARGKLHQMDRNNTPSALHAELLEEGSRHDGFVLDKGVGVQQGTADDGDDDDGEPTAEDLTRPAAEGTAGEGAEVGDNLGDCDGVGGEAELVGEHGWIEVLGAVGLFDSLAGLHFCRGGWTYHEVEAGHEQDEIDQQQPVALKRDLALLEEGGGDTAADLSADGLALTERLGLGETQTEGDDEDGRASSEPVEGSPAVRGGVDEGARKSGSE